MLPVKHPEREEEREIFPLNRTEEDQDVKKGSKKFRISLFNIFSECLRGKGFVEIEVSEEDEDAFVEPEKQFDSINVKETDI